MKILTQAEQWPLRCATAEHVTLYHHTTPENADKILNEGFGPNVNKHHDLKDPVWLTTNREHPAISTGGATLAVNVPSDKLVEDWAQPSTGAFTISEDKIPGLRLTPGKSQPAFGGPPRKENPEKWYVVEGEHLRGQPIQRVAERQEEKQ